jgi:hypothetical protein
VGLWLADCHEKLRVVTDERYYGHGCSCSRALATVIEQSAHKHVESRSYFKSYHFHQAPIELRAIVISVRIEYLATSIHQQQPHPSDHQSFLPTRTSKSKLHAFATTLITTKRYDGRVRSIVKSLDNAGRPCTESRKGERLSE